MDIKNQHSTELPLSIKGQPAYTVTVKPPNIGERNLPFSTLDSALHL